MFTEDEEGEISSDSEEIDSYDQVSANNTTSITSMLSRCIRDIVYRSDKLQLRSSHADVEKISVAQPDMDGFVASLQSFASVKAGLTSINMSARVCSSWSVMHKTNHKNMHFLLPVTNIGNIALSIVSTHSKPLALFSTKLQCSFDSVQSFDRQRPTVLRN